MSKIELTPEFLNELTPPVVHICKRMIIFNPAASKKLALNINDRFTINIDGDKLLILPSATKGFVINKSKNCMQATSRGLLEYLVKFFKIVPDTLRPKVTTVTYEVGEFKEGSNPLNYLSYKYKTPKEKNEPAQA